jgi:hypothetical protein
MADVTAADDTPVEMQTAKKKGTLVRAACAVVQDLVSLVCACETLPAPACFAVKIRHKHYQKLRWFSWGMFALVCSKTRVLVPASVVVESGSPRPLFLTGPVRQICCSDFILYNLMFSGCPAPVFWVWQVSRVAMLCFLSCQLSLIFFPKIISIYYNISCSNGVCGLADNIFKKSIVEYRMHALFKKNRCFCATVHEPGCRNRTLRRG